MQLRTSLKVLGIALVITLMAVVLAGCAAGVSQEDFNDLKGNVSALEGLDDDVSALESDVSAIKSDIGTLETDAAQAKVDITGLKSDVSTTKSDIGTLQVDTAQAKADVTSLKSDVSTTKSDVSSLRSDVDAAEGSLSDLEEAISDLESDLGARVDTLETDLAAVVAAGVPASLAVARSDIGGVTVILVTGAGFAKNALVDITLLKALSPGGGDLRIATGVLCNASGAFQYNMPVSKLEAVKGGFAYTLLATGTKGSAAVAALVVK